MNRKITIEDVKNFVEKKIDDARCASSADMVSNCRAQAYGVIMFAQQFIPFDDLYDYWEGDDIKSSIWQKFNDIAREKSR